jgi:hypothetical protein
VGKHQLLAEQKGEPRLMPGIAPSTKIREEITRLLRGGVPKDQDVVGTLLRLGAQRLTQELLEEEATDFLGWDRYVRHRGAEPHRGYRNGYEPGRVRTTEGDIPLQVPQIRQTPVSYRGGPADATKVLSYHILDETFRYLHIGYASVQSYLRTVLPKT